MQELVLVFGIRCTVFVWKCCGFVVVLVHLDFATVDTVHERMSVCGAIGVCRRVCVCVYICRFNVFQHSSDDFECDMQQNTNN